MHRSLSFVELIDLRESISSLSESDLLEWLSCLVSSGQKQVIVSGVFRELYHQGRNIDVNTFDQMVTAANDLVTQSSTITTMDTLPHVNTTRDEINQSVHLMNHIPDTILSHIATYLQTRELSSIWNNICKRSLRLGMKPESIQHWDMQQISPKFKEFAKFDIFPLLSNLKNITYDRYGILTQFPTTNNNWNRIDIHDFGVLQHVEKDFAVRELILSHADGYCNLAIIEQIRHCLKRLAFVHGNHFMADISWIHSVILRDIDSQKDDIINNERDIFELLQMIIPLSKKDYQIASKILEKKIKIFRANENFVFRDRLPNGECSTFVTPYLTDKQIEKITKDAKEEIESKYDDTVDLAEELSYYDENNNTIAKNEVTSLIDMLEFDGCDVYLSNEQKRFVWNYYLRDTYSRIVNGLQHLKGLAFCGYQLIDHGENNQDEFSPLVVLSILNSIGNKLLSLHLCDCSDLWNVNLYFYKQIKKMFDNNEVFDDEFAKKCENESWYLKHVSELCLKIQYGTWNELLDGISPLINGYTFPSLKHLKIICFGNADPALTSRMVLSRDQVHENDDGNGNNNHNVGAFGWRSLITRGLESLYLMFDGCTLEDFFAPVEETKLKHIDVDDFSFIGLYLNNLRLNISESVPNINNQTLPNEHRKFILKLQFKVDISKYLQSNLAMITSDDIITSMSNGLAQMCEWLCQSFGNAMFCFKIVFQANGRQIDWVIAGILIKTAIVDKLKLLCNAVCNNQFFISTQSHSRSDDKYDNHDLKQEDIEDVDSESSTHGLVFELSMKEYVQSNKDREVVFAMVLNKQGRDMNGHINGYCEQRFDYPCNYCQSHPWLGPNVIDQYKFNCEVETHHAVSA